MRRSEAKKDMKLISQFTLRQKKQVLLPLIYWKLIMHEVKNLNSQKRKNKI